VIDLQLRYVRGAVFGQKLNVRANLVEWENRLKINYLITDPRNRRALDPRQHRAGGGGNASREMQLASPKCSPTPSREILSEPAPLWEQACSRGCAASRLAAGGASHAFASKLAPTGVNLLLWHSGPGHAFDLQQLSDQLAKPDVIHGSFIQEKHLRALPQPLVSKGTFVLAKNHGLLWLLKTPLQQDYRITAQGIARRDANGWQCCRTRAPGPSRTACSSPCCRATAAACNGISNCPERRRPALEADLTPRSLLLKQVFTQINIDGGELVQTIELLETQGDSTVLRMQDSTAAQPLSDAEQHDFAE
jgi:hypothetical protein